MGSSTLHPSGITISQADAPLPFSAEAQGPGAVPRHSHRAVALFIGGAGDKKSYYLAGPYRNMAYALAAFDQRIEEAGQADGYQSLYLGYHEVWSATAIGRLVAAEIHDKDTPIYIVGHSLGAWSGAHLSQRLSEWGYRVEMLVTLDPVGSGLLVRLGSRTPHRPAPRSRVWTNVRAKPLLPHLPRSHLDILEFLHPGFISRQMAVGFQPDVRAHRQSAECPRRCAAPRPG